MAGGPSKVKPPNSHPANQIHKQATEAQGLAPKPTTQTQSTATPTQTQPTDTATQTQSTDTTTPAQTQTQTQSTTEPVDSHHVNKTLVAVGVLACVGLIVYASS